MLNSLKGPGRSRAPATAITPRRSTSWFTRIQRVAEPLPNPLSDDVSRKEELSARRDRHGDK